MAIKVWYCPRCRSVVNLTSGGNKKCPTCGMPLMDIATDVESQIGNTITHVKPPPLPVQHTVKIPSNKSIEQAPYKPAKITDDVSALRVGHSSSTSKFGARTIDEDSNQRNRKIAGKNEMNSFKQSRPYNILYKIILLCISATVLFILSYVITNSSNNNKQYRDNAQTHKISTIDKDSHRDISKLIEILKKGELNEKVQAAGELAQVGSEVRPYIPQLVYVLEASPPPLSDEIYNILLTVGPPDSSQDMILKYCLQSQNRYLINYAINIYSTGNPVLPNDMITTVVDLLSKINSSDELRIKILRLLSHLDPSYNPIMVEAVLENLSSHEKHIYEFAYHILDKKWHVFTKPHVGIKSVAISKIVHTNANVRKAAVLILSNFIESEDVKLVWKTILSDPEPQIRRLAIDLCIKVAHNQEFLKLLEPNLLPLIHDKDDYIRMQTAIIIRRIQNLNLQFQYAVLRQYEIEKNIEVTKELAYTLAMIIKPEINHLSLLKRLLTHPYSAVRKEAAKRLREMGSAAKDCIPDLISVARNRKETDIEVRIYALEALSAIGPRAVPDTLMLIEELFSNYLSNNLQNTLVPTQQEELLLLAAIRILPVLGLEGKKLLVTYCHNANLSVRVREAIFKELIHIKYMPSSALSELVRFVETQVDLRSIAAEALAVHIQEPLIDGRYIKESAIDELLLATSKWKPPSRAGGKRDVQYSISYRTWAISVLGKLNFNHLSPETRERITKRLTDLSLSDSNPQINAEAKMALQRLKWPTR